MTFNTPNIYLRDINTGNTYLKHLVTQKAEREMAFPR